MNKNYKSQDELPTTDNDKLFNDQTVNIETKTSLNKNIKHVVSKNDIICSILILITYIITCYLIRILTDYAHDLIKSTQ